MVSPRNAASLLLRRLKWARLAVFAQSIWLNHFIRSSLLFATWVFVCLYVCICAHAHAHLKSLAFCVACLAFADNHTNISVRKTIMSGNYYIRRLIQLLFLVNWKFTKPVICSIIPKWRKLKLSKFYYNKNNSFLLLKNFVHKY